MVSEGGPHAFLVEYSDGFRATLLHLTGYVRDWQIALRVGAPGQPGEILTSVLSTAANPHPSFSILGLNIQQMILTGEPTYAVERMLLVTGALDALMRSHAAGHTRVPTPYLSAVRYTPMDPALTIRGHGPVLVGASVMAGAGDSLRKTAEEAAAERAALQQTQAENLKAAKL